MFDNDKIVEAAKKLGLIVEVNSKNPGVFFENEKQEDKGSYNFAELDIDFIDWPRNISFKENDVSIKSAEEVIIRSDLKYKEVEYFKSNKLTYKKYSGTDSKNVGEMNYDGQTGNNIYMKVNNEPNKTDKAA
ncbi:MULTISPECIES: hypothetical protein [unclassified Sporosarcina]|uniref:hypothetical protein n=1 Tax=unclassified Sporosarcina TaxID=2647733 RepID=UPI00203DD878|nr:MULTISPECIES: hypothetical protein [unclassified Sporosarcina]GKV66154.1 hypothetical protein NCCP2331_23070 [Sporosarcina sp. NCCP-2331]GLB56238.1 hypothetical protein NCCP2378_20250 [Sporosarcina sp. NCCP-2378]